MTALRINDSGQRSPFSNEYDKSVNGKGDNDSGFYFNQIEKAATGERGCGIHVRAAVEGVKSGDPERQFPALLQLPKLYDFKDDGTNAEIVPGLVNCLAKDDFPDLQYVAARLLCYLAKDNVSVLIENDAVPEFQHLLCSGNEAVQRQALLAVASLTSYSLLSHDDRAIHDGTIKNLLPFFRRPKAPFELFAIALKTMICIIRCKPIEKTIFHALPALKEFLKMGEYYPVQKLACEAVLYFSEVREGVEEIIEAKICPRLVDLLFNGSPDILLLVMETIANIARYGHYREVINDKALSCILEILSSHDETIKLRMFQNEACNIITSITDGTHLGIELLIKADLIPPFMGFLVAEVENSLLKEDAAFGISAAISNGTEEQVEYFVDVGYITFLCNLITPQDVSLTAACLRGLERMLTLTIGNNKDRHVLTDTDIVLNISKLNKFEGGKFHHIFTQGKRIINCICFALDEGNHFFPSRAKKPGNNL